jgi:hypothetical protein
METWSLDTPRVITTSTTTPGCACIDLMTSHRNDQWLRNLITGDEKWVLYIN